jgi:hypothetical protein
LKFSLDGLSANFRTRKKRMTKVPKAQSTHSELPGDFDSNHPENSLFLNPSALKSYRSNLRNEKAMTNTSP